MGAGRIGLQTLKAAEGRGLTSIAVANRTKDRAVEVSERFRAVAHDLTELEEALASADVAITATSSEAPVVGADVVRAAMSSAPTACSSSSTSPFRRTSSVRQARSWA